MERVDVIVVGGGLSGCGAAAALADLLPGRRILVLEARAGRNPRFNGELIHPTGVDVLDARGFLGPLHEAGGSDIAGFAGVPGSGHAATLLPYAEIPGSRAHGFAIDHHDLVDTLRARTLDRPNVELRTGERVLDVLRDQERVVGVNATSGPVFASLVIGCDGRHSKLRTQLGVEEHATLLSFTAAALLEACALPHPGYGHIFLGGWGPILVYPIGGGSGNARACIDLPADRSAASRGTDEVTARIRAEYLQHLPPGVRAPLTRALDAGEIEVAANYSIYTDECTVPGAVLVGDACGCSHPLTATGMTIALTDTRLLAESLARIDLDQEEQVDVALARYQTRRYRYVRAREVLADALYEVFRGADDGTRAIREGIFRYWNRSVGSRARSMALLSGHESRLPAFLREYLTVAGISASAALRGQVPGGGETLQGRMRSFVGLGKKSFEKIGLVARL